VRNGRVDSFFFSIFLFFIYPERANQV